MKIHELQTNSRQARKRKGRGISAGQGKTAGRGTKGQNARSGGQRRPGFEGGQQPLMQRIPKLRGFRSHRPPTQEVTLTQLNHLKGGPINAHTLHEAGLIKDPYRPVKLIATGEVSKKFNVQLSTASVGARAQLEKAGGSFTDTPTLQREKRAAAKQS